MKKDKRHFSLEQFNDIDSSAEVNNYFYPVLEEIDKITTFKDKIVLDVGCGTGIFVAPFAKSFQQLIGIDGETSVAQRSIDNGYSEVKEINDFCYDKLPFKDSSFDLVICKDVFEHLIDPLHLLREIHRITKVNGHFLFHVPNHFPLFKRLRFVFKNNLDTYNFFPESDCWDNPHLRFYNERDILTRMNNVGFKNHKNLSHHFPAFPLIRKLGFSPTLIAAIQNRLPDHFNAGFTYLFERSSKDV